MERLQLCYVTVCLVNTIFCTTRKTIHKNILFLFFFHSILRASYVKLIGKRAGLIRFGRRLYLAFLLNFNNCLHDFVLTGIVLYIVGTESQLINQHVETHRGRVIQRTPSPCEMGSVCVELARN